MREKNTEAKNLTIRLITFRNANQLSQHQMATKLGIARSAYSKIESRKQQPSITFLRKAAKLIGITMEQMCEA